MTTTTIRGQARIVEARAMELFSLLHDSPTAAIGEYVDNAADAGADQIWVVLNPDTVVITDNGHGMVPTMLADDISLMEMYIEDLKSGKLASTFDLREYISLTSRRSLQWLMERIAFSGKLPKEGDSIRGMRGIGALSFRQLGNGAIWITRPELELFAALNKEAKSPPAFVLYPPTTEQLRRFDSSYKIEEDSPSVLKDPYNKVLKHGTRVEILDLKEEIKTSLRPGFLLDVFSSRFGNDVAQKRYTLTIVDRVTADGRKERGGKELLVQPPSYKGIQLLQETPRLKGGRGPFKIELYYDPNAKRLKPTLRRKGADVRPITELDQLNIAPWNSGKITGYIEYPDLPEEEAPWSADKRTPLPCSVFTQWLESVKRLETTTNQKIEEIENREKDRALQRLAKEVAQSVVEAMSGIDAFKDLVLLPFRKKVGNGTPRTPKPTDQVTAVVYNEHGKGVSGVRIELYSKSPQQLLDYASTGSAGNVSFGCCDPGTYLLRMIVPDGMESPDPEQVFSISQNQEGKRVVFHLVTGSPKPVPKNRITGLVIHPHAWANIDEPYSTKRMHIGIFEINTAAPDFAQARTQGDTQSEKTLITLYTSMGVTEHALVGSPNYLLTNAAHLFARATFNGASSSKRGKR